MKDKLRVPQATKQGWIYCEENGCFDMSQTSSKTRRGRVQGRGGDICPTLMAGEPEIFIFLGYEET